MIKNPIWVITDWAFRAGFKTFLTQITIYWTTCYFLTLTTNFDFRQHFDFTPKFRFFTTLSIFIKISISNEKYSDYWPKFCFWTIFRFSLNFQFFAKIWRRKLTNLCRIYRILLYYTILVGICHIATKHV